MKRSKINKVIKDMEQLYREEGFHLPPFADWTPQEWQDKGHEYDEIRDNMLGWDVTDYNSNDFDKVGAVLFTYRNGDLHDQSDGRVYCEKYIIMKYWVYGARGESRWRLVD